MLSWSLSARSLSPSFTATPSPPPPAPFPHLTGSRPAALSDRARLAQILLVLAISLLIAATQLMHYVLGGIALYSHWEPPAAPMLADSPYWPYRSGLAPPGSEPDAADDAHRAATAAALSDRCMLGADAAHIEQLLHGTPDHSNPALLNGLHLLLDERIATARANRPNLARHLEFWWPNSSSVLPQLLLHALMLSDCYTQEVPRGRFAVATLVRSPIQRETACCTILH